MYKLVLKLLFLIPAERAHYLAANLSSIISKLPFVRSLLFKGIPSKDPINILGLTFPNRIGLAAGFDKDGTMLHWLSKVGFGFVEVGTVTPKAQVGNPKPRLFRLKEDQAIINRMGFNNKGVDALVEQLKNKPKGIIIGGNIGKNKDTPNEKAIEDYKICFTKLFDYVDYFVVNVSSPNTKGLRDLQHKESLVGILSTLQAINHSKKSPKPILLKIAPDLTEEQIKEIAQAVLETNIHGVIATNTTTARSPLKTSQNKINEIGSGGLSGKPVKKQSDAVLKILRSLLPNEIIIIGVGGIDSLAGAQNKIDLGANLVQVYTGFIYKGPAMVQQIARSL